jgi:TPR repeat protein
MHDLRVKDSDDGFVLACANVAHDYHSGRGVEEDTGRAATLFARYRRAVEAACEANVAEACGIIGGDYASESSGFPKDVNAAVTFSKKACDLGNVFACANTAYYLEKAGDANAAVAFFDRACEAGDSTVCLNLVFRVQDKKLVRPHEDLERWKAKAFALDEAECNGGKGSACTLMATLDSPRKEAFSAKAARIYEAECAKDVKESCFSLAVLHDDRTAVSLFDPAQALTYKRRACELGDQIACGWEPLHSTTANR